MSIETPLSDLHREQGGHLVDFAGYSLPVRFEGIVAEHLHTRTAASLFDVSHMGQVDIAGAGFHEIAAALEQVIPADLGSLQPGDMRYSVLLNARGTIEDDLIVSRLATENDGDVPVRVVVNAARKYHDLGILKSALSGTATPELLENVALIALQGPQAAQVVGRYCDAPQRLSFMQSATARIGGADVWITRSGYTGEDGFELAVAKTDAERLARLLLSEPEVAPAGLGARDSLRLEAGLCLYGHDIDENTDPVSAGLLFTIGKSRRETGGFAGFGEISRIRSEGPRHRRVGVRFDGRLPVREGADLINENEEVIGRITSGTFSPTLQAPIAMGYGPAQWRPGQSVTALVRGKPVTGQVTPMPFVPHNYKR